MRRLRRLPTDVGRRLRSRATRRLAAITAVFTALSGAAVLDATAQGSSTVIDTTPVRTVAISPAEPADLDRDLERAMRASAEELAGAVAARQELVAVPAGGAAPSASVWDRLAHCESGGRWQLATGNGFYGGLQFTLRSWRWVGGTGYPHEHPREVQIRKAERLLAEQGWQAWPRCSRQLGLR